ncbi:MAG: hypothetical protein R3328_06055, partial [Planococcaceae bacterium]|nr:hypothetical protein [Planococcaceae bacterium]
MKLVLLAILSFIMLAGCTNNQGSSIGTMDEPSRDETHEARPADQNQDDNTNGNDKSNGMNNGMDNSNDQSNNNDNSNGMSKGMETDPQ